MDNNQKTSFFSLPSIKENEYFRTVQVINETGTGFKRILIYDGHYFMPNISDTQYKQLKLVRTIAYIAVCALYLFAALRSVGSNSWHINAGFGGLSLASLIFLGCHLFPSLSYPKKMTIPQYKSTHESFPMWCIIAGFFLLISSIANLYFLLFLASEYITMELLGIFTYASSAVILFTLARLELHTPYTEEANENNLLSYDTLPEYFTG